MRERKIKREENKKIKRACFGTRHSHHYSSTYSINVAAVGTTLTSIAMTQFGLRIEFIPSPNTRGCATCHTTAAEFKTTPSIK